MMLLRLPVPWRNDSFSKLLGVFSMLGVCSMLLGCSGGEVAEEYPLCPVPLAPICGEPCPSSCGCAPAIGLMCLGDKLLWGQHTCYQLVEECAPGACVDHQSLQPNNAYCAKSCEEVKAEYLWTLGSRRVGYTESGGDGLAPGAYNVESVCYPDDCTIVSGHCDMGLGTCWYLGPRLERLDQLATFYEELGCVEDRTCDCPEPPGQVTCGPAPREAWVGPLISQTGCIVE